MSTENPQNPVTPVRALANSSMTHAMALNLAAWHRSSVQALGVQSFYTDTLWWRRPGGSGIYLGAIILDAQTPDDVLLAELNRVRAAWGTESFGIYDGWAIRDLSCIGLKQTVKNPWYLRLPANAPTLTLPEGLTIEIAKSAQQLADFERASWEGFEEPDDPEEALRGREPFSQHGVATLNDPGMYYLNARLHGQVVAGTIVYITDDMVGIYGISTRPAYRRRGYATLLVHASLALRPDLPTSVFPDPESLPIYTRVGFVTAGEIAFWQQSTPP